jgi:hypothetical protein
MEDDTPKAEGLPPNTLQAYMKRMIAEDSPAPRIFPVGEQAKQPELLTWERSETFRRAGTGIGPYLDGVNIANTRKTSPPAAPFRLELNIDVSKIEAEMVKISDITARMVPVIREHLQRFNHGITEAFDGCARYLGLTPEELRQALAASSSSAISFERAVEAIREQRLQAGVPYNWRASTRSLDVLIREDKVQERLKANPPRIGHPGSVEIPEKYRR